MAHHPLLPLSCLRSPVSTPMVPYAVSSWVTSWWGLLTNMVFSACAPSLLKVLLPSTPQTTASLSVQICSYETSSVLAPPSSLSQFFQHSLHSHHRKIKSTLKKIITSDVFSFRKDWACLKNKWIRYSNNTHLTHTVPQFSFLCCLCGW